MGPNPTRSLISDTLRSLGLATILALAGSAGQTYYVDSTNVNASNSNTGQGTFTKGSQGPFATLAFAATAVTAARGDVIIVMPNHAESIIAAGGITFSKSGVTVIGVGNGRQRPTFTWSTATTATMLFTAANVRITNCVFLMTGIDQLVSGMVVSAADIEIDNNEFELSKPDGTAVSAILGILTAATAARLNVHDNFAHCPITITTNTVTAFIQHEVGINFRINNNTIHGKLTQGILNATTILEGEIGGNQIHVYTGTAALTLAAATQCHVHDNNMVVASGTTPIVGAAASFTNNHYTTEGNGPTAGTALAF